MQLTKDNELEFYNYSITQSRDFWRSCCEALNIQFKNNFKLDNQNIVDISNPKYPKWFIGAEMNIADSLLYTVKTNPEKIALIYEDELGNKKNINYSELDKLSNQFANALKENGINKGDHIALSSGGMNLESIATYLGAMKVGAIVVCLLPSTTGQMQMRLNQIPANIKLMVTQNYIDKGEKDPRDLYEKLAEINSAPKIIIQNHCSKQKELKNKDTEFYKFIEGKSDKFESASLSPEDYVAILFSSGTTGTPKAIPWRLDCYIKSANDARLHMQIGQNDILCWPSNFGWMMGSFDIAAAFINGSTLAVYEGNVACKEFGEFLGKNKITRLGIIPRFGELWQNTKCLEGCDLSSVKVFMSTSAASNPDNYTYIQKLLNGAKPCEYSGGTEIAGALNTCLPFADVQVSKFNSPAFGTKLYFKPEENDQHYVKLHIVVNNEDGYVPPMGLSKSLVNPSITHDEKYPLVDGKYRPHGDTLIIESGENIAGEINSIKNLKFRSGGRDLLNINGNKVGFEEIEQWVLNGIKNNDHGKFVKDLVVFQTDPDHGSKAVYYVQLHENNLADPQNIFTKLFKTAIAEHDKRFAVIGDIKINAEILRNGSKVMRNEMQREYQTLNNKGNL